MAKSRRKSTGASPAASPRRAKSAAPRSSSTSLWEAKDPSKAWYETFTLMYAPVWIIGLLGLVVQTGWYEKFGSTSYMMTGLAIFIPCFAYPLLYPGAADLGRPLLERHWVKASVWNFIYSHIGNYFWTHYFYRLLGAKYTFPAWRINDVPYCLFLITQAYFSLYHALSNRALRRLDHATRPYPHWMRLVATVLVVFILAYITAFMETLTIANFPYYEHKDKKNMYLVGSVFYAIYFWVSFPMFYLMDEDTRKPKWTLNYSVINAMAAGMICTILLDGWRLIVGPICDVGGKTKSNMLPWL